MQSRDQMSHFEPDTKESMAAPQESLDMVAALLSEPRRWTEWLSQHPQRSELFAETFRFVVRLEQATRWETNVLLTQLGCRTKTTDELGKMDERQLQRCCEYFGWVESLVLLLSGIDERRQIVSGAALLYLDSSGGLDACKQALEAGDFSAGELMALGEVESAWAVSRLHLDAPAGDRARLVAQTNPFARERPHLSVERLDQFGDLSDRHMDSVMRTRIADHLDLCSECHEVYESRRVVRESNPSLSVAG